MYFCFVIVDLFHRYVVISQPPVLSELHLGLLFKTILAQRRKLCSVAIVMIHS